MKRAVEQLQLAVHWALLHPCRDEYPRRLGGRPRPLHCRSHPWPVPVHRWSTEFAPASFAAALGITLEAGQAAARRRPRADLPTPPPARPGRTRAVPVWRARAISRETHDLSVEAVAFADRLICATPVEDRAGRRRPAGPGSPAVLRPRPRHRRRGTRTHPTRRLATAPRQPRHHRRRDDPGHPRRPAVRPDRRPHRRRTRQLGDTDQLDVRRARAVGILADPQYALDLMSGREAQPRRSRRHDEPLRAPRPRPDPVPCPSRSSGPPPATC